MARQNSTSSTEIKRVGIFGVVGIVNTLIDFTIYNLLSSQVGLTLVQSNIVSTTIAMIFSFLANKHVVFKDQKGSAAKQIIGFFVVTAFGLYVLQTGTIEILTHVWFWPLNTALSTLHEFGFSAHYDNFIIKNGAKVIATLISLTWNYILYKKVVFK